MKNDQYSYSCIKLDPALSNVLREIRYNRYWEYEYAKRHIHSRCFDEIMKLAKELEDIARPFYWTLCPDIPDEMLISFGNKLVYAWHRIFINDGYRDYHLEPSAPIFEGIIQSLNKHQTGIVQELHRLTVKFGFFILDLTSDLSEMMSAINFFIKPTAADNDLTPPEYTFIKDTNSSLGIQISFPTEDQSNYTNWDLAIFIDDKVKAYHVRKGIDELWGLPGQQVFGDRDNFRIAFYMSRSANKKLKKTRAIKIISLQMTHHDKYLAGEIVSAMEIPQFDQPLYHKESKDLIKLSSIQLASLIERLSISEGLVEKRRPVDRENIRNAVGLLFWDKINIDGHNEDKKKLIETFIPKLPSKALEVYYRNYYQFDDIEQKTLYGESEEVKKIVYDIIREDIRMADKRIANPEIYPPSNNR